MSAGNQFALHCCSDLMPLPHSLIKEVGVYQPFSQNTSLAWRMGYNAYCGTACSDLLSYPFVKIRNIPETLLQSASDAPIPTGPVLTLIRVNYSGEGQKKCLKHGSVQLPPAFQLVF